MELTTAQGDRASSLLRTDANQTATQDQIGPLRAQSVAADSKKKGKKEGG
jgi:hypothetical protein